MKILNSHYEKIVLVLVVLISTVVSVLSFFGSVELENTVGQQKPISFSLESFGGEEVLKLEKKTELLPNDIIEVFNARDELVDSFTITKVIFPKRSRVSIGLKSLDVLTGKLLNPSSTILSKGWEKSRSPIAIDTANGIKNVSYKEIEFIRGEQQLILNKPFGNQEFSNCIISTYQSKTRNYLDVNRTERSRWISAPTGGNSTIYDLFTPPIIYLVDGALSTTLPKATEEGDAEEAFGLSLISFDKEVYRFKMSGWIGNAPYFEDLQTKVSGSSSNNVRNRVEAKKPYKLNPNFKPGSSTLIETTMEDEAKLLIVEYFAVQQIPNKKTGGLRPVGRALVKDFQIGGDAFEINSLMKEVFSGQYSIVLKFEIPGKLAKETSISEKDIGRTISFYERTYEILTIDSVKKELTIRKTGPLASTPKELTLRAL
ncbi:MAG: hypothetical protein P8O23_06705 [Opitutales bacterium]|nr:hypothetical protein [Opitutales bacterium]